MGLDLLIAFVGITSLAILAFHVGSHLGVTAHRHRPLLFVESILFTLAFAWTLEGKLAWATAIPASSVVYWSNWMPIFLGFTIGLARWSPGMRPSKRPVLVACLVVLAVGYAVAPIARPLLSPASVAPAGLWKDGICLQSHPSTCAAASAVTLLQCHGIATDERSMLDACLTSRNGTVPLGLFRGLSLHATRRGHKALVASREPDQWATLGQLPNVALLRFDGLPGTRSADRLLGPLADGPRSEGHAVVVLGRTADQGWLIGDPAVGLVRWSDEDFRSYFSGDAVFLKVTGNR